MLHSVHRLGTVGLAVVFCFAMVVCPSPHAAAAAKKKPATAAKKGKKPAKKGKKPAKKGKRPVRKGTKGKPPPGGIPIGTSGTHTGWLELITFTNGADVYVGDKRYGKTPVEKIELAPGKYTVKVKKLGHTDYIDVWVIRPGETASVEVMLIPTASYVVINANVEEARIDIDSKYVGMVPYEGELLVGKHELRVSKLCFKDYIEELEATAGSELKIDVELTELPPALNPCIKKEEEEFTPFFRRPWFFAASGGLLAGVAAIAITILIWPEGPPDTDYGTIYSFPR